MNDSLPIAGQLDKSAICQLMADRIPGIVWATDVSLRFTASFGTGLADLDLQPGEVKGTSLFEFFQANEDRDRIIQAHCRALSGTPVDLDFSHLGRDYLVHIQRMTDDERISTGCVGFAQDITEYKMMGREIRQSEAKYRRLHQSMQDAFVSVDMTGRIQEFNEPYRRMLGYEPEELKALTYVDLTPEKWHQFEATIVEQQILKRRYSDTYEKEYRRKDGTIFPVELRTFLLTNNDDQPSGMWAIVRDITDRKRSENAAEKERESLAKRVAARTAELERANASLKREIRERMKAENELHREHAALRRILQASDYERQVFTEEMHDNVVQILLGGLWALEAYKNLDDRNSDEATAMLESGLDTLRQASASAVAMQNLVLTPILENFGVSAAIADFIDQLGDPPEVPEVLYACDSHLARLIPSVEQALFRVAQEAITNACNHSESEIVRVTLTRGKEEVRLEVEDWGKGFDPIYVIDNDYGLSDMRERARVFGNGLELDTELERGTRVRAAFPLIYRDST